MTDGLAFAVLGSGSAGNALVVESGQTRVLIDAGFSPRSLERRLAGLACDFETFDAIVVTHEHIDHWRGVPRLSSRYRLPVWLTPGTHAATRGESTYARQLYSPHESFSIGDLEFCPYPIPHDAREPAQLVVSNGDKRLGVLSDAGYVTPHIRSVLNNCAALLIEANHDTDLLARGPYPDKLKRRVTSNQGHLGNHQAAELLAGLNTDSLRHVAIAHMSEKNNHPDLARSALAEGLGCGSDWIQIADQHNGLGWRNVS